MLRVCGKGCEIRCFTLSFLLFSSRYLARPRGSRTVTHLHIINVVSWVGSSTAVLPRQACGKGEMVVRMRDVMEKERKGTLFKCLVVLALEH